MTRAARARTRPVCDGPPNRFAVRRTLRSFITEDVWRQYIETARHLLAPAGGLVVLTTVLENARLLAESLDAQPNTFLPSIPNLPYQVRAGDKTGDMGSGRAAVATRTRVRPVAVREPWRVPRSRAFTRVRALHALLQYAVYTNFRTAVLDERNPEVAHDPAAFFAAPREAAPPSAEAPLRGAGHSYDFEAMLEAELRRQEAQA